VHLSVIPRLINQREVVDQARRTIRCAVRDDEDAGVANRNRPRAAPNAPSIVQQLEVLAVVADERPPVPGGGKELMRIERRFLSMISRRYSSMSVEAKSRSDMYRDIVIEIEVSHGA